MAILKNGPDDCFYHIRGDILLFPASGSLFAFIMGIEEEFDIEIPAEAAEKISTVEEA